MDNIAAFKHRWQLSAEEEAFVGTPFGALGQALLRPLSHRELRYVLEEFDGTRALEELLSEAASAEADEAVASGTLAEQPAVAAIFGDANLSFAVKLARHREALGHVGKLIATTFETLDCLRERYKEKKGTLVN